MKGSIQFFSFGILFALLLACSPKKLAKNMLVNIKPKWTFTADSIPQAPDYSDRDYWFLYQDDEAYEMDVFYVHPTTYLDKTNWNQPLSDTINTAKTIRKTIKPHALLFDSIANVFMPRYRQATFYSFFDEDSNGTQALDLAFLDVKMAFEYFIRNANKEKPIIIAGHSQGALLSARLLKEKSIQNMIGDRLVIAYLIGWAISEKDLAEMPYTFCKDSTELSCLASWNSQRENASISMTVYAEDYKVFSTNPLSWKLDEEYYDNSYNRGALIFKKDTLLYRPHFIGAKNVDGILAIDKPKEKRKLGIRRMSRNYHLYDIAFFYYNLQQNATLRKETFLSQND